MQSLPVIIATVLLIFASSVLTGCSLLERGETATAPAAPSAQTEEIRMVVQQAAAAKKAVGIKLVEKPAEGSVTIDIMLENAEGKAVNAAQTWLSFDPAKLKGVSITADGSDFELAAPYKQTFDNENGLVMIGRAAETALTANDLKVATVMFEVLEEGTTMIDVYDYREDPTGHATVNSLVDGKPFNILIQPESPALVLEN